MTHDPWENHLLETIETLKRSGLHRTVRTLEHSSGPEARIAGRDVLLFCSNDYLGLASHPRLVAAARDALDQWGAGAGASRLICGNLALYEKLEQALAAFKSSEAALVFSSGYATHAGVIPALAGWGDVILSDELNHASIVDACRLSRARVRVFPHRDVAALADMLDESSRSGKLLVVTDGVFSMDGDLAPLADMASLCDSHGAMLLVDDAHGTGVLGPTGSGSLEHLGAHCRSLVCMGTFSKALGGLGGFIAGTRTLVDYLWNRARSVIFSTALPPATLASNLEALHVVREEPDLRDRLTAHARRLRSGLRLLGFSVPDDPTPIVPLVVGSAEEALALSGLLWDKGIFVPAIRPPTVPEGTSRLRISVSAAHREEHIDRFLQAVGEIAGDRSLRGETAAARESGFQTPSWRAL